MNVPELAESDAAAIARLVAVSPNHEVYELYSEFRRRHEVLTTPAEDFTIFLRYWDVRRALSAPGLGGLRVRCPQGVSPASAFSGGYPDPSVVASERLRDLSEKQALASVLAPSAILSAVRATAIEAERLAAKFSRSGGGDLVAEYARPVTVCAIGSLLGVESSMWPALARWSEHSLASSETDVNVGRANRILASLGESSRYFHALEGERVGAFGGDLISRLKAYFHNHSVRIPQHFIASVAQLIATAGIESTTTLMCDALVRFGRPDLRTARGWNDIDWAKIAVEETLRLESPVQGVFRVAEKDVAVGNTSIREGSLVLAMIGSANQESLALAAPSGEVAGYVPHLAFGHGPRACLGATLAREIASIGVRALLHRSVSLTATEPPRYAPALTAKRLPALQVSLERSA